MTTRGGALQRLIRSFDLETTAFQVRGHAMLEGHQLMVVVVWWYHMVDEKSLWVMDKKNEVGKRMSTPSLDDFINTNAE